MKNWVGNKNSVYRTLGASSHSESVREPNDYYATDPRALELLLELEKFQNVLEPACGEGHLSKILQENNIQVTSSDLIDRNFGCVKDFFEYHNWNGDIITNPPYKIAQEFVEHAIDIIPSQRKIAMFLKLQFLESKGRRKFFTRNPPIKIYVSSSRILCAKNGDFTNMQGIGSGAVAYAWFIWKKGFTGKPAISWFN